MSLKRQAPFLHKLAEVFINTPQTFPIYILSKKMMMLAYFLGYHRLHLHICIAYILAPPVEEEEESLSSDRNCFSDEETSSVAE